MSFILFSRKDIFRIIIPILIDQFFVLSIGMASTIVVASSGEAAFSAVSLIETINRLVNSLLSSFAIGGTVAASHYLGANDNENACRTAKQLYIFTVLFSVVIMLIFIVFNNSLIKMIFGNLDSDTFKNASVYLFLSVLSYPFFAMYNSGASLFRAMGRSKEPMYVSFIMNTVNIILSAVFIFGLKAGVAGAGAANLLARIAGSVIITVLIRDKSNPIYVDKLYNLSFDAHIIKRIIGTGLPNGIEGSMFELGRVFVAGLISSFGRASIAANGAANSVTSIALIPATAVNNALIPIIGACAGADEYEQAEKNAKTIILWTIVSVLLVNMLILIFVRPIASWFKLSPEANRLAVKVLTYHSICAVIWPLSFSLTYVFRAANDVIVPLGFSIASMWLCRIFLSYFLSGLFEDKLMGIWVAMTIDWAVRTVFFTVRFKSGKWKGKVLPT